jgi:hypothetical protein
MAEELDRALLRHRLDEGWLLTGLGAKGPIPRLRRQLDLFGQFVGDWEIFPAAVENGASRHREAEGEAHWRWVMGGLAVQDVWGHRDRSSRGFVPEGSTIRFFDPEVDAWRSTWISPYQRVVRRFLGRPEGNEIVLRELGGGWRAERWIFSEIERQSFRWRAESRSTPNGRRRVTEDYRIVRMGRT